MPHVFYLSQFCYHNILELIHTSKVMQFVKLYVLNHMKIYTLMLDEEYKL